MFVPVVDSKNRPLMPTTPSRAKRWIKAGKATPFWKKGVFCVRLNVEPSLQHRQPIAVGIDPGSKREAFTVKSQAHTYLNIQTHAVDWVKDHVEVRRNMRRARRFRNTPCRQNRTNRLGNDTYEMRQSLGLKKSKQKLSNKFEAHCVDSWILANWHVGGHSVPDNTTLQS